MFVYKVKSSFVFVYRVKLNVPALIVSTGVEREKKQQHVITDNNVYYYVLFLVRFYTKTGEMLRTLLGAVDSVRISEVPLF
jgi:hypothetical protein